MHREKSICYKTKQILAKLEEEPGETGGRYSRCSCDYVSESFFIFSMNSENSCMGSSKKGPTLVKTLKFGRDIGRQSWNPAFYPLRSPDPLPSASGTGNLTTLVPSSSVLKKPKLVDKHIGFTFINTCAENLLKCCCWARTEYRVAVTNEQFDWNLFFVFIFEVQDTGKKSQFDRYWHDDWLQCVVLQIDGLIIYAGLKTKN